MAFQAGLIASMLPAILLSGFIFQIRIMPVPLQVVTYLVPARYFLVILRGIILKGEGLATYWPQVGALVLYAVATLAPRLAAPRAEGGLRVRVLWRVIVKEFLQIRRDRKMIPVIFVAPIVQIIVFGFAVNTDVTNVPTVLVDQDRSAASRDLVSRFVELGLLRGRRHRREGGGGRPLARHLEGPARRS